MKSSNGADVSVEEYAGHLISLVRDDLHFQSIMRKAMACGDLACWEDLHDYVDANEYTLNADDYFSIVTPAFDDDLAFSDRLQFLWSAIALAEAALFGTATGGK